MRLALLALVLAACTGDDGANANPQCTGKVYDLCHDEHDCTDPNVTTLCRPFDAGIYCTTGCTPGDDTTCPKQHGKVVTCNAQSLCEAEAPNVCVLGATD